MIVRTDVPEAQRKRFFFEKKKQKTFLIRGTGFETGTGPNEQSFFCFFFVHKKEESFLPTPPLNCSADAQVCCLLSSSAHDVPGTRHRDAALLASAGVGRRSI
jgi:hypothetical protein